MMSVAIPIVCFRGAMSLISPLYFQFFPRRVMYTIGILIMALGDIVIGVSLQYNLSYIFGLEEDNVVLKWMPVIGIGLVFFGVSCGQLQTIICLQGEIMPSFGRAIGQAFFCTSQIHF